MAFEGVKAGASQLLEMQWKFGYIFKAIFRSEKKATGKKCSILKSMAITAFFFMLGLALLNSACASEILVLNL